MKIGMAAIIMAVLMVTPAMAQLGGKSQQQEKDAEKNAPQNVAKRKAEEEAYRNALKSIPESKTKRDPWSGAR